jgi:Flp pilus assembly protein TadG
MHRGVFRLTSLNAHGQGPRGVRLPFMRPRAARSGRREKGQALVEMALVLPFLLLLVTAVIQFGAMYNTYEALTDASRAGARELALGAGLNDPCDLAVLQTIENTDGAVTLPSTDVTPTFTSSSDYCGGSNGVACTPYVYDTSCNSGASENQGDEETMTIKYPYTLKVFGISIATFNLTAAASDAIE